MKILGLLRHAKSDWDDLAKRDFDRGLNERGRRGAKLIGQHIAEHGVTWERIVASPAARVQQTLEEALPGAEIERDRRLYLASTETLMEVLREQEGDPDTVLLAGHNPGMQDMLFQLVSPENENALFDTASLKFPTAAFAVFELNIEKWSEVQKECGAIVHFARPRDLDASLGPID